MSIEDVQAGELKNELVQSENESKTENVQSESESNKEETVTDSVEHNVSDGSEVSGNEAETNADETQREVATEPTENEVTNEESVAEEPTESADEHVEEIEEHEEIEIVDYEKLTKPQLFIELKKLSEVKNVPGLDRPLKEIKVVFDGYVRDERQQAFDRYIADGGDKEGFEYHGEAVDNQFDQLHKQLREKKHQYFVDVEKSKERNLERKNTLLEELRVLVDGEETNASLEALKKIQDEWKEIGPVHQQHNKTLWANYNALITRFYDNRSIYFELKELDRKKNLKSKLAICERAEELSKLENVKEAVKELNVLHDEFKHIGPIPKEDQEPVWQRFKAASDLIYSKRKELVEQLKFQLQENLAKKEVIIGKVLEYTEFDSDRINEWNKKTKEILEIQKEWEVIGAVPKEVSKETNKKFWSTFKVFFHNKSEFFKKLEGQRKENLAKKEELVVKAEALSESSDWEKTAEELKVLQRAWKEIGPVPEKFKDSVYEKFKAACDSFFNRKREQNKEAEKEYYDNMEAKEKVLKEMEALCELDDFGLDQVYDMQERYSSIGFVPKNAIRKMQDKYNETIDMLEKKVETAYPDLAEDFKFQVRLKKLKSGPNAGKKLNRKESDIKKKIQNLSNDITNWRTNMEFFSRSKGSQSLKGEMELKIKYAEDELETLRSQLKMIRRGKKSY